ncbi:MAG: AzlC family ABC transporter permease [Rhizobiales bacterium]|nr:AzlC family ABC transporter permease [Hyphomicrobiales bacterium]
MHRASNDHGTPPRWSLSGLVTGAHYVFPLLPGAAVFAAAFGTLAAQKGLSFFEATLMSAAVFAGASQFAAMEIWSTPITLGTVVSLALVVGVVNMRMLLMGASLRPWLGGLPAWQSYPTLLLTTDASWLIASRYRAEGGTDAAILFGGGLTLWLVWVPMTSIGFLFGSLVDEPRRFALDLILPIYFIAMLVPLWRGPRRAIPWAVGGATALLVQQLVPGFWYIVVGAFAGAISGGFIDDAE